EATVPVTIRVDLFVNSARDCGGSASSAPAWKNSQNPLESTGRCGTPLGDTVLVTAEGNPDVVEHPPASGTDTTADATTAIRCALPTFTDRA
ncbi:MAG: hypothetical protein VB036_04410, partial [Propionicimonas sp.]|nr:hypothetical protein [Propionicimonas sp.]